MIHSFNKFVYRIPAYPLETLTAQEHAADIDAFLANIFQQPSFMEAMYMASPEFTKEIPLFLDGTISEIKRLNKFRNTALKYIGRMASRPTPFGLFSGCAVGTFGEENNITPHPVQSLVPKVRIDMGLLTSFAEYLVTNLEFRKVIRFYSNNTIYQYGEKYRYVEFSNREGEKLYNLSTFESNEYIDQVLSISKKGASFNDYENLLVSDEVAPEDVQEFINDLIHSKILISELEPYMTGIEYDQQLFNILADKLENQELAGDTRQALEKYHHIFTTVRTQIRHIEEDTTPAGQQRYEDIIATLRQLDLQYPVKHYLQLDSYVAQADEHPTLSNEILKDVIEGVSVITRFTRHAGIPALVELKRKFSERYEGQRVRLSEVLDPEAGLGYGNANNEMLDITPFVDDMPVSLPPSDGRRSLPWQSDIHGLFLRKALEAARKGERVARLTKADIELLKQKVELLPPTFNAYVSISYDENGKHQINYHQVGSSSASCLLGRFGFLDKKMESLVQEIHDYEAAHYPGKIVAEINHLSETRVGNVMLRPKTRAYEICYVTKSNIQEEGKIELNDLSLFLRNNKLVLYSESLQQEIVPRLSNAHNYYKDTLPVYKFLSDLQEEESNGYLSLVIDIGPIPELVDFIPRIQYRNFIIWPAHWYIPTDDIRQFYELPPETFLPGIQEFLKQRNLPECFYLTNRENDLFVDSTNIHSLRILLDEIKGHTRFAIKECLIQRGDRSLIANEHGGFLHELIVPLYRDAEKKPGDRPVQPEELPALYDKGNDLKRTFYPGEEWVYFKLYAGVKVNEKIATTSLAPFIQFLRDNGMIDSWFFIRYTDPGFHLRIRMHLTHRKHYGAVVEHFVAYLKDYLDSNTVKNLVLDTYTRELERYGNELTLQAEKIFSLDSDLSLKLLDEIENRNLGSFKWLIALGIVETYLEAFDLDQEGKLNFTKRIRDVFAREFNANKMQRRHFSAKYRDNKNVIEDFLEKGVINNETQGWLLDTLREFRDQLAKIYAVHYSQLTPKESTDYLNSFIHMSVDRFFSSKNRLHEYALYSLLEQNYRYKIGKIKFIKDEEPA